ncbi:TIGR02587 family membrane protein [Salinarimonas ramus]|uniref:Membrane protein n=1 Tax=Salinarimonas ramus TaxID=690164 RepID=A0A917QLA8_9HYPH|nr:TIGR02587 family membrane protein [Salinarimonas ramus]GGK54564.1 membrane protein [Salinarimonas ramus]
MGEDAAPGAWARDLARGFAGAVLFALPLLMTMEMWWIGLYASPGRLALFLVLSVPLLIGLAFYAGFRDSFDWRDDVVDAFTAIGIGAITAGVALSLFGVIRLGDGLFDIVGKIAVQTVPASMGAALAREQLGGSGQEAQQRQEEASYLGKVFLMAAGALYLAFNVAPTEEMILIAFKMTPWHGLALVGVSLAMLHAFVYEVDFYGGRRPEIDRFWPLFLRYSVVGYAVALLVSAYVLWTFERFSGLDLERSVMATVVLGFPAALGAAAARLVL